jgi:acetyl esterase/lipase
MLSETIVLNKERNVTLTSYIQPVGGEFTYINKRLAVIVIPGGGYQFCSDREAEIVAFEYLRAGYHAFVLGYSIKENAVWPNPLNDYEQAMELIRSRAEEWHIYEDKIAVLGFSAGGHLASAAATMSKNRLNAALLGYTVIRGRCALIAASAFLSILFDNASMKIYNFIRKRFITSSIIELKRYGSLLYRFEGKSSI